MSAPVKHTCPDIDKIIKAIKNALKMAQDGKNDAEKRSHAWDCFDGIEDELYRLDDVLEELRASNKSLREWGEELQNELEDTVQYYEDQLSADKEL